MYYYTYNTHILAAAGIVGILVIAVVLTALLAVLVLPKHKDGKLPAFFQLLFDAFTPKTLLLEKILQVLNVFFSLVAVLLGLVLIFQGLFANTTLLMMGLLLLLLGPLLCRVGYELILLRIMQVKATREINRKLSFLVPEGAAQAAEEEDLPKEPEAEAPAAKTLLVPTALPAERGIRKRLGSARCAGGRTKKTSHKKNQRTRMGTLIFSILYRIQDTKTRPGPKARSCFYALFQKMGVF